VARTYLTDGPPKVSIPPPVASQLAQLAQTVPSAQAQNVFNVNVANSFAQGTNGLTLNGGGQNPTVNVGQNQMVNGISMNNTANFYPAGANAGNFQSQRKELQVLSKNGSLPPPAAVERSGWAPLEELWGAPSAIAVWYERDPGAEVRGAELNVGALAAQLADTLPAEFAAGDGYALLNPAGQVQGLKGDVPAGVAPDAIVPLDVALLPGWSAAGFMPAVGVEGAGRPLFVMGSLLTGILVTAILASGSLLLLQARASAAEARQKTSFVTNVSHEFKTPLTTIRLYAELLEQGRVRDEAQRAGFLHTIGAETKRLARLVNHVLDFSQLEQGKRQYLREPLDLTAELAAVLDTQAPRLAEAGLGLVRELPDASLPLLTDRDAVVQIVLNLLENACKYAAGGGEVTVSLAPRPGGGADVSVLDRGPGVPPAHRERIFEQFHRVDATLTAEKSGAGLGLSIARQLARGLGGDLRHTARPGGGATFILELP
jgi:signal transduction histidine kinase